LAGKGTGACIVAAMALGPFGCGSGTGGWTRPHWEDSGMGFLDAPASEPFGVFVQANYEMTPAYPHDDFRFFQAFSTIGLALCSGLHFNPATDTFILQTSATFEHLGAVSLIAYSGVQQFTAGNEEV